MRKKKPPTDQELLNIQRAAYLKATYHGMTEQAIADTLGGAARDIYYWTVHRWLDEARKSGLLVERTVLKFVRGALTDERLDAVTQVASWHELAERLRKLKTLSGVQLRSVRIFASGDGDVDIRIKRFAVQASAAVAQAFERSDIFALAWGFTISSVIDALEGMDFERPSHRIQFIPVCCDELGQQNHRTSSSALAARLDELVNPRDGGVVGDQRTFSLHGVPAFTPHWFANDVRFREYLHDFPDFHAIFGLTDKDRRMHTKAPHDGDPLIERVDTLLTSIGSRSRPVGRFYDRLKKHGQIGAEELSRIVVGDVGGVLIPSPDCRRKDLERVAHLNEIWSGLQRSHLEDITRRAGAQGRPGVIVVSIADADGARSKTLAAILRAGLVNELIIDTQMAEALTRTLAG